MTGTDIEDRLLADLRMADPVDVGSLASPTDPGPARLLEAVVADSPNASPRLRMVRGSGRSRPQALPARRGWISAAAAAAVIAVVAAAAIVVYDTGTGRDATAAVHQAVAATIEVSDSATSFTTVTYDFDDFAEPWEMTIETVSSGGDFAHRMTAGPAVPEMGIPDMGSYAEVVVGDQAYRSAVAGHWEGPYPYARASGAPGPGVPLRSNLTFGVTIDELGDLYDFAEIGETQIEGVDTTHYRTHSTPDGAGAGFLMSLGMFMTATNQVPPERLDDIQLDVWVDGDDLIRRVSYIAVLDGIGAFSFVTDWDNFGQAPPITAPTS